MDGHLFQVLIQISILLKDMLSSQQFTFHTCMSCRENDPPTYHVRGGIKGRISISLTFEGNETLISDHLSFIHLGVDVIPGAKYILRSFFKRLKEAFQNEPVNKVRGQLSSRVFENMFGVQMCEKHYQKMKNGVYNKHALQALPGKF